MGGMLANAPISSAVSTKRIQSNMKLRTVVLDVDFAVPPSVTMKFVSANRATKMKALASRKNLRCLATDDEQGNERPYLHLAYCVSLPSRPIQLRVFPIIDNRIVAIHFSPPFEHDDKTLQPAPAGLTLENSQTPPAEETARREVTERSGFAPGSHAFSDQEPTNVCSARNAALDARPSSVSKSHLSSAGSPLNVLNSRSADRADASQPRVAP